MLTMPLSVLNIVRAAPPHESARYNLRQVRFGGDELQRVRDVLRPHIDRRRDVIANFAFVLHHQFVFEAKLVH